MREIVKIRSVAGSLVVSLPQSILGPVGFLEGDRVVVESAPPRRLIVTREGKTMTSAQHLAMEIDLLEKKKIAIESDLRFKARQHNDSMPCENEMGDRDVAVLWLMRLERDRDKLDVEIAEKRLELYNIQAGEVISEVASAGQIKKVERAWYYLPHEGPHGQFLALANAKGSCSLRRFDAEDGAATPKERNRPGDYRNSFAAEIRGAIPVFVEKQPNLERDCKVALPSDILQELRGQIQRASHSLSA